jgi:hypothetical protein
MIANRNILAIALAIAAVAAAIGITGSPAEAGGRGKEVFVQDRIL